MSYHLDQIKISSSFVDHLEVDVALDLDGMTVDKRGVEGAKALHLGGGDCFYAPLILRRALSEEIRWYAVCASSESLINGEEGAGTYEWQEEEGIIDDAAIVADVLDFVKLVCARS